MINTVNRVKAVLWLLLALALLTPACGSSSSSSTATSGDTVIITDREGRDWDITHAVAEYGMDEEFWNFGLGIENSPLQSVDAPQVYTSEDSQYPGSYNTDQVFGVDYGGEKRAYLKQELIAHEVFNDYYASGQYQHVAVTY